MEKEQIKILEDLNKLILLAEENKSVIDSKKKKIIKIRMKSIFLLSCLYFVFASFTFLFKFIQFQTNSYFLIFSIIFVSMLFILAIFMVIKLLFSLKEERKNLKIDIQIQKKILSIIDENKSRATYYNSISDEENRVSSVDLLIIEARIIRLGFDLQL